MRVTRGLLDIAQEQLRASLDASAAALHALRDSTQALNSHSRSAQDQRMIDALLSRQSRGYGSHHGEQKPYCSRRGKRQLNLAGSAPSAAPSRRHRSRCCHR